MKQILKFLNSKMALGIIIILMQFAWIIYTVYETTVQSSAFNMLLRAISLILALYVISRDIKPINKLSWVFLILFLPIFGCPCYFLFGRRGLTRPMRKRMEAIAETTACYKKQDPKVKEQLKAEDEYAFKQTDYVEKYGDYPLYFEEDSKYYSSGEDMFPDLLEDLKKAEKFIFLEYFIMEPGKMFDSIIDILEQKAKEGVQVRLIYDDFGCITTLPKHYYKTLQEKGIHCGCFNPFRPFLSIIMNNRDHRKILVVDGKVAYTGGVNLADEYINEIERFGYWKDAAIRLTGPCVDSFTTMFLEMWNYIVKGTEDYTPFLNKCEPISEKKGGYVQPYADSPLDREDLGENVYMNLITHAKKYVYIFTPYLIIGSEMARTLVNAAKDGVDVRIVTPGIPDKKLVYQETQANYESLLRGGVKIYQYKPGFIHSKCFVVDDKYAAVGSVNMDFRSFYLHFECGVLLYQAKAVEQVKQDAVQTIMESEQVSLEYFENKNLIMQLYLSILHLFSPLL